MVHPELLKIQKIFLLVGRLIQEGIADVKIIFEDLLSGSPVCAKIDEQIIFSQLDNDTDAIWSLLLASGYLKLIKYHFNEDNGDEEYVLALTNKEIRIVFEKMI